MAKFYIEYNDGSTKIIEAHNMYQVSVLTFVDDWEDKARPILIKELDWYKKPEYKIDEK